MDKEKRARELQSWIEAYVREEVEKQLEEVQCEQPGSMAQWLAEGMVQWLAEGTNETTDADGFTAEDRRWLRDLKILTGVIQ